MGERTVTATRLVEEQVSVPVCDRCGLEADESVALYRGLEREVFDNRGGPDSVEFVPTKLAQRYEGFRRGRREAWLFRVPSDMAYAFEDRPEPFVEVCEDCYEEMFGWSDING